MSDSDHSFWDAVDDVRARDGCYRREAYGFVVGALGLAVRALPAARRADPLRRHLSGQELLGAIVHVAHGEFGAMAATVFREWGVISSDDVGRIVFQLVEAGQLSARPEDSPEDFRDGIDLMKALSASNPASAPR